MVRDGIIKKWGWSLLLSGVALAVVALLLVLPLGVIISTGLADGWGLWFASVTDFEARRALLLTLGVAAIVVPVNLIFGVAAAWCLAKFRFKGRALLLSLLDLPFAVSPVIAGMIFVLLFGRYGWFGNWLHSLGIKVIFGVPGIVLTTLFVTLPFVARELLPLLAQRGSEEELAALSLGAGSWQSFWLVTLPSVRWGLLYGITLTTARAVGEFGAVSVVSGHIRGETNTFALHIEELYNEYSFSAAFACATLLAALAVLSLVLKAALERRVVTFSGEKEGQ